jgi:uncharacterized membrane protein YoaK (UPF0700 family)
VAVPPPAPEETRRVAILLSLAGGFLDAFTWVGHGGVFANAQTGNVVLLGVFAASGQGRQALRHVPPICAFVIGVFAAGCLRLTGARRPALLSLGVEIALLVVVAALPQDFPDLPIVVGIAFVAALQTASFARVERSSYSSVMTTGNLRHMAEALFAGMAPPRDPSALQRAQLFATICTSFGIGAGAGALATPQLGNAAVAVPVLLLVLALLLCLRPFAASPGGS